jgi:peptide/nickel transport system ATP-binding protein
LITHDLGVVSEIADRVVVMYCGQVVEEASVDDLFDEALQPYTVGLMNSIPSIDADISRLESIQGNVPPPTNLPPGCRFAPRCPHAFDRCFKEIPALEKKEGNRSVRCFLYDGKEAKA